MTGVYDYTVILTYLSFLSALAGIFTTLGGESHPYIGILFLMFSGVCDAFDGKIARTKKNRTEYEKKFGIQIDSLSDIVAFGILPSAICISLFKLEDNFTWVSLIPLFYSLAALIRLAHYNVTEDDRQKIETGNRAYFEGVPVTASAVVFPVIVLIQQVFGYNVEYIYLVVMSVMAVLFVAKVKVKKPGTKAILILLGIGLAELIAMIIFYATR